MLQNAIFMGNEKKKKISMFRLLCCSSIWPTGTEFKCDVIGMEWTDESYKDLDLGYMLIFVMRTNSVLGIDWCLGFCFIWKHKTWWKCQKFSHVDAGDDDVIFDEYWMLYFFERKKILDVSFLLLRNLEVIFDTHVVSKLFLILVINVVISSNLHWLCSIIIWFIFLISLHK